MPRPLPKTPAEGDSEDSGHNHSVAVLRAKGRKPVADNKGAGKAGNSGTAGK